ncbi:MAG: DUF1566 domain-containing protein [Deltaproteobacteria bacterium]|nr:DUF1566 domain-containing protein [Deltaproteobacteria bacterium]
MARIAAILVSGLILVSISPGKAQAQANDHLACYRIKGEIRLKGLLDIETPQFGLAPGCKITKPKFFCAPATRGNMAVLDVITKAPVTPLPLITPPAPSDRICWQVKCPPPFPPDQLVTDPFGTQIVSRLKPKFLCTPAVKGTDFCGDGSITGTEECEPADDGACPDRCQPDCSCAVIPSTCGNDIIDGNDDCDGLDLGGESCQSLGFGGGLLACSAGCGLDLSGCSPLALGSFSATGQTSCWDSSGTVIPCVGTGHDGEVQAGAALAYVDNGDGTITDLNTGLMWEKKSDDDSIHDQDTSYTWDNAFALHITTLNDPIAPFAGHTDWRVPNLKELQSLVDLAPSPTVDPAFNTGCVPSCTVASCSCTPPSFYWSSSTFAISPTLAWAVLFSSGVGAVQAKSMTLFVRAVRGGL